jgi:hypothetical protein
LGTTKGINTKLYNFEIEKIHDTVWVFKNAVKNTQDLIYYFEKTREWRDWYIFGKVAEGSNFKNVFNSFPNQEEWDADRDNRSLSHNGNDYFENQINDLFYQATKLYVQANNVSLDNWIYEGWNVGKYQARTEDEMAMAYHTDYQREYTHNPGSKFIITAVFYLNDNYSGGDVAFKFLDNEDVSILKEEYTYKPQAGDIVIFLSGHPHYHGVKAVTEGEKYIIRTYWRHDYPGHPLWLKLQKKYGEKRWEEMEKERVRATRKPENITSINEVPFWATFEEYYEKEIAELD